ncbi:cytochrome P450-like enzyme [Streptantibioticus cattleyicolor NRRL 8057 = DSM 46488]|uniref:Cytochrome P450-like enzyme n=1 Tax=Streptantibioticus cattleyicolor (strain ATCC 35852 / DSM 46488 / JCM 4925 / NBRC 14057 / NRRL 8057) TaxID=1003195 RepID=G8WYK1_STREN|nr:cytochrome P450-like enzyme [Streptantibioticus cattleyicolor NRRL 8057 = DSM 46488]
MELDQEFYADPHPTYRAIKAQGNRPTPIVLRTGMAYLPPGLRGWLVTAYQDVEFVLRDPRFRKSIDEAMPLFAAGTGREGGGDRSSLLYDNMANNDPPKHTRLRKPLNATFTARAVATKRRDMRRVATETLDALAGRDTFDLVQDFAFPFSIAVICDTLGVPREDRGTFHSWVQTITGAADHETLRRDTGLMAQYLRDLIGRKRAGTADDVLTQLATSLAEDEAVAQAYALLAAGYETTANLIVTGFLTLERNPEQKRRLWSDPSLVPGAVEEMLRHQSPFNLSLYRYVTEDVEVGGVEIPAGAIVFLSFAAANRDEHRFADPDAFDITTPRREHLAFGGGIHNCIGKHLARLEAEVAFDALVRRCPGLSVVTPADRFVWKASPTFRGLKNLAVGPGPRD